MYTYMYVHVWVYVCIHYIWLQIYSLAMDTHKAWDQWHHFTNKKHIYRSSMPFALFSYMHWCPFPYMGMLLTGLRCSHNVLTISCKGSLLNLVGLEHSTPGDPFTDCSSHPAWYVRSHTRQYLHVLAPFRLWIPMLVWWPFPIPKTLQPSLVFQNLHCDVSPPFPPSPRDNFLVHTSWSVYPS